MSQGVKSSAPVQENIHGREQGRELGGRSQETGGARHQPGEALHSRPPHERWQDNRPWRPLETLLADAAALKNSESLLSTTYTVSCLFLHL